VKPIGNFQARRRESHEANVFATPEKALHDANETDTVSASIPSLDRTTRRAAAMVASAKLMHMLAYQADG
jgi:hypothetical protein